MMFVGGPPTVGPGAICDRNLANVMRSHTDIQKGRTPFLKEAEAHYQGLANRCVNSCHVIDIFASSLDQIGLLEMKSCVDLTGGLVVLADSFGQSVFKESLTRVFTRHAEDALPNDVGHLTMAFAGTLECITSREYRVRGAIGPCSSLKKKSSSVSDNPLGQGGTYAWRIGGLTPATTIGLYFEVSTKLYCFQALHNRLYVCGDEENTSSSQSIYRKNTHDDCYAKLSSVTYTTRLKGSICRSN